MLTSHSPCSHLHRIPADELWFALAGDPIVIVEYDEVKQIQSETLLGTPSFHFMASPSQTPSHQPMPVPMHVVRGGTWFGAYLPPHHVSVQTQPSSSSSSASFSSSLVSNYGYSLVACVVTPGFCFEDFKLATAGELTQWRDASKHSHIVTEQPSSSTSSSTLTLASTASPKTNWGLLESMIHPSGH